MPLPPGIPEEVEVHGALRYQDAIDRYGRKHVETVLRPASTGGVEVWVEVRRFLRPPRAVMLGRLPDDVAARVRPLLLSGYPIGACISDISARKRRVKVYLRWFTEWYRVPVLRLYRTDERFTD